MEFQFDMDGQMYNVSFQGRVFVTPVTSWWLTGGISPANAIVAYKPKGAASLAASYVNLASPGTNDAVAVNAPDLVAAGWDFELGNSDHLTVAGVSAALKPMTMIVRTTREANGFANTYFGASANGGWQFRTDSLNALQLVRGAVALIGAGSAITDGVDTVVAVTYSNTGVYTFYINGVASGTGTNDVTPTATTLYIGARYNSGATEECDGIISACAMYDTVLSAEQIAALSTAMAAL